MAIDLASPLRKLLFAGVCLAATALYLSWTVRPYLGTRAGGALDRSGSLKRIAWEPGNAEHRAQLGRYYLFVAQDGAAAAQEYRAATALNPHLAQYWLELANAYQLTGDAGAQKNAVERALEADPNTPVVAWEAANYFLLQGETERALQEFRIVLAADPYKVRPALELCWRVTHDAGAMVRLLPPDPVVYFNFVQLLAAHNEGAAAAGVWQQMIALGKPLDPKLAFPYFEYLLAQHEVQRAQRAWKELATITKSLAPYVPGENLLVNGGFKEEILNGGFDWRYRSQPGVTIAIDTAEFHGGSRSLSLSFEGEATGEAGLWQLVPVEPNTHYEFTGFAKAEGILSASGPRLAILDGYTGAPLLQTDEVLGSTSVWQEIRGQFQTHSDTTLVAVKIVRLRGETKIRGKLWLDDLSLVRK